MIAGEATSCAMLVIAVVARKYAAQRSPTMDNAVTVPLKQWNLWDAGTLRGKQLGQLQSVSFPAVLINLTIVLPRHSAPGQPLIALIRDQSGDGVVAVGLTSTTTNVDKEEITTSIDLSKARAGEYFLATTHKQDQTAYHSPLPAKN